MIWPRTQGEQLGNDICGGMTGNGDVVLRNCDSGQTREGECIYGVRWKHRCSEESRRCGGKTKKHNRLRETQTNMTSVFVISSVLKEIESFTVTIKRDVDVVEENYMIMVADTSQCSARHEVAILTELKKRAFETRSNGIWQLQTLAPQL